MGIKRFETRSNLIKKLKDRQLIFNEEKGLEILKNYNYFRFFNGFETLFLDTKKPKRFKNIKLQDFLNLYQFDKKLNFLLLSKLDFVEGKLKNSIAYHFSNLYCLNINDTMQYTNKNNFMDPSNNNSSDLTYCPYSSNYPFCNEQNYNIYCRFNDFIFFKEDYLNNLIKKYDHIDPSFYMTSSYNRPTNVATYTNGTNNHVAVPLWVAIETLSFGEVLRLLHYLKDDVMIKVLGDFGVDRRERDKFLNMIDFLLALRNHCAHNSIVIRFRSPKKYCINSDICTIFELTPKNRTPKPNTLKLFDVLKILNYFIDVREINILLRNILIKNILSMGLKRGKKVNEALFKRIGGTNYKQWKKYLNKNRKYTLQNT